MTEILLAIAAMFLVIIGGIAGLYYKLGQLTQVGTDHGRRIVRLEDRAFAEDG